MGKAARIRKQRKEQRQREAEKLLNIELLIEKEKEQGLWYKPKYVLDLKFPNNTIMHNMKIPFFNYGIQGDTIDEVCALAEQMRKGSGEELRRKLISIEKKKAEGK